MTNYVAGTWFDPSRRRAVINPADGSVLDGGEAPHAVGNARRGVAR